MRIDNLTVEVSEDGSFCRVTFREIDTSETSVLNLSYESATTLARLLQRAIKSMQERRPRGKSH